MVIKCIALAIVIVDVTSIDNLSDAIVVCYIVDVKVLKTTIPTTAITGRTIIDRPLCIGL